MKKALKIVVGIEAAILLAIAIIVVKLLVF